MSGIVGLAGPWAAEPGRIEALTQSLAFRAPDGVRTWRSAGVALGHALLRTGDGFDDESQPATLDGQAWITADARVDAQDDLRAALAPALRERSRTDAELILAAWQTWGADCVDHLIGDFAFGIWDERRQELFCARDQIGIRPFFYAVLPDGLVFSNTLETVLRHTAVPRDADEVALGDFLVFQLPQDLSATAYRHVRRLPPAHTLTLAPGAAIRLRRYWELPIDDEVERTREEHVERYRDILGKAVGDRVRGARKASVFMSGGLDSPTVAAAATRAGAQVRAVTGVFDRLAPDEERRYSQLVADALGIAIVHLPADDHLPYVEWDAPRHRRPEPLKNPFVALDMEHFRTATSWSPLVLTGHGGDLPFAMSPLFLHRLTSREFWRRAARVVPFALRYRRLAPLGLRTRMYEAFGRRRPRTAPFPAWLQPDFVQAHELRARWAAANGPWLRRHPRRPESYEFYACDVSSQLLEMYDGGTARLPLEARHPLFDLRLVRELLTVPYLPWAVDKALVRRAMRGVLPAEVLARPKTPLAGNPFRMHVERFDAMIETLEPHPALARYVDVDVLRRRGGTASIEDRAWTDSAVVALNHWLGQSGPEGDI